MKIRSQRLFELLKNNVFSRKNCMSTCTNHNVNKAVVVMGAGDATDVLMLRV